MYHQQRQGDFSPRLKGFSAFHEFGCFFRRGCVRPHLAKMHTRDKFRRLTPAVLTAAELAALQDRLLRGLERYLDRERMRRFTARGGIGDSGVWAPLSDWKYWWEALVESDQLLTRLSLTKWLRQVGQCWMVSDWHRGAAWVVSDKDVRWINREDVYLIPVNSSNECYVCPHEAPGLGPWLIEIPSGDAETRNQEGKVDSPPVSGVFSGDRISEFPGLHAPHSDLLLHDLDIVLFGDSMFSFGVALVQDSPPFQTGRVFCSLLGNSIWLGLKTVSLRALLAEVEEGLDTLKAEPRLPAELEDSDLALLVQLLSSLVSTFPVASAQMIESRFSLVLPTSGLPHQRLGIFMIPSNAGGSCLALINAGESIRIVTISTVDGIHCDRKSKSKVVNSLTEWRDWIREKVSE